MKSLFLLFSILLVSACNDAKKKADCSSADNCSDQRGAENTNSVKLKVNFADVSFYDQKLARWRRITKEEMAAGGMGAEVPVYSDFVNLPSNTIIPRVQISAQQALEPSNYSPSTYNIIPYIEVIPEKDVTYVYNYKKIDLSGVEVGGKTGSMVIEGDRAFLPLTNEMFGGIFFPANATSNQSSYSHRVQIVAQSPNQRASDVYTITFKASLIVPNRDFSVEYSAAMRNITMQNRWNHFYNVSDGVANTNLDLATLVESTATPESIPLDIKVVFKNAPKIEMAYSIFDEDMLVRSDNTPQGSVALVRGHSFYEKTYVLNSDAHFGLNFKINNQLTTLTASNREGELRNVPAGELWRLTFGYNLTQNALYTSGKQLLKPLRPICSAITNQTFNPILELQTKNTVTTSGGYLSVCHPKTLKKETIYAADIGAPPVELTDSWYWGFSYMPNYDEPSLNPAEYTVKNAGHFYGVKQIEFRISGCMKVMTREASPAPINPNVYEVKNNSSASCSTGPGDTGWMAFEITKMISIFDDTSSYDPILKELVTLYRSAIPKTTLQYFFNGDTFYEHIH